MALYKLQPNELPSHQMMDYETLNYIKSHNPFSELESDAYSLSPEIVRISLKEIKKLVPSSSWFINNKRVTTIHGIRHLIRVALYSALLYFMHDYYSSKFKIHVVLISAMLHDIRRRNDKKDNGHSKRGSEWFRKNVKKIENYYDLKLDEFEIQMIADAILLHDTPYTEIDLMPLEPALLDLIDILKTADALDRYVQPNKKWWINESYLRIKPSVALKKFAYDLVVNSEDLFLKGDDNLNSIIKLLRL